MRRVIIKTAFDCTLPGEERARMHYKDEQLDLDDAVAKSCVDSGAGAYLDLPSEPKPEAPAEPTSDADTAE